VGRDGGENVNNGGGPSQGAGPGTTASDAAGEGPEGGGSSASFEASRERPVAPLAPVAAPPARDPAAPAAPRPAEAPAASTGTDNKYVVWSSAPSDAPRTGPDDR